MPSPLSTLQYALEQVLRVPGVDYADARIVDSESESIQLRFDEVEHLLRERSRGIGVRVLYEGAWGFAARPGDREDDASAAARTALEVARAAATIRAPRVRLSEEHPQRGRWHTPVAEDPFTVPLDRKLDDLRAVTARLRGARITSAQARMSWHRDHKWFASTEGSALEQSLVHGGAGIKVVAQGDDELAVRSWPMDLDGAQRGGGYEVISGLRLEAHAERITEEARALLVAAPCPAGRRTLVLDTPQLALQIHESCGHPTESDRALGHEISLAGASFLTPDERGRLRYGSPIVNLSADSLRPGGVSTFGWDDEGVPARRTPLVEGGVFVGYLSSRETAARLGLSRSAGCMRAASWSRPPIIRMINVSLEPDPQGPSSLEELIADTDDGILMTTNRSWSIDDLRLNFQFSCEAGWEIKRGRLTRLLKRPLYTGSTPQLWASCDAIGSPQAFRMVSVATCGKGDPLQLVAVGHGCAPARFRGVEVGTS